jgi:hypothetical protein
MVCTKTSVCNKVQNQGKVDFGFCKAAADFSRISDALNGKH